MILRFFLCPRLAASFLLNEPRPARYLTSVHPPRPNCAAAAAAAALLSFFFTRSCDDDDGDGDGDDGVL